MVSDKLVSDLVRPCVFEDAHNLDGAPGRRSSVVDKVC